MHTVLTALEALLVEGKITDRPRLRGVHGLAASWALDLFWCLEGHGGGGAGGLRHRYKTCLMTGRWYAVRGR